MYIGMYSVENEKNEKIWDVVFMEDQKTIEEVYATVSQIINKVSVGSEDILVKDFTLYKVEESLKIDLEKLNEIRKANLVEMDRLEALYTKKDLTKEEATEMMKLTIKYPDFGKSLMAENEDPEEEEAEIVKAEDEVNIRDEATIEVKE